MQTRHSMTTVMQFLLCCSWPSPCCFRLVHTASLPEPAPLLSPSSVSTNPVFRCHHMRCLTGRPRAALKSCLVHGGLLRPPAFCACLPHTAYSANHWATWAQPVDGTDSTAGQMRAPCVHERKTLNNSLQLSSWSLNASCVQQLAYRIGTCSALCVAGYDRCECEHETQHASRAAVVVVSCAL